MKNRITKITIESTGKIRWYHFLDHKDTSIQWSRLTQHEKLQMALWFAEAAEHYFEILEEQEKKKKQRKR